VPTVSAGPEGRGQGLSRERHSRRCWDEDKQTKLESRINKKPQRCVQKLERDARWWVSKIARGESGQEEQMPFHRKGGPHAGQHDITLGTRKRRSKAAKLIRTQRKKRNLNEEKSPKARREEEQANITQRFTRISIVCVTGAPDLSMDRSNGS